jgi:hypothetical protein
MRIAILAVLAFSLVAPTTAGAQRRAPVKPKPAPRAAAPKTEPAQVKCPESLGTGLKTGATYCFILAARQPAEGVIVTIPPHTGEATLIFDLHNRHTYSEEDVRAGRGFARYSAGIGILTMDGTLVNRAAVRSEFRTAADLHERIGGGAGPSGAKAVAPLGSERVYMTIPAGVNQVSLLGDELDAVTAAGRETATPGRTVAIVSNIQVEYRPAPVRK